jgi:kynurenine formamidase
VPRIVDLTHPFDDQTIFWSEQEKLVRANLSYTLSEGAPNEGGIEIANFRFCVGEHGGTHMDAPLHFAEGKRSIADIPIAQHIGPGFKIDISEPCARDRDYCLQTSDILAWESRHGAIPKGAIVLIRTGWDRYWGDRAAYLGATYLGATYLGATLGAAGEDASSFHFPGIGQDAAALLAHDRRIAMVGLDTASLDHGPSKDFPAHRILCGAEIPGIESVAHLDLLPETGFLVLALPMKIAGGSGAPTRIVALLER